MCVNVGTLPTPARSRRKPERARPILWNCREISSALRRNCPAVHPLTSSLEGAPRKRTVEQYVLSEISGQGYELLKKVSIGDYIESLVMTGFKIPVAAIFDEETNRMTLKKLLLKFL